MSNFVYIELKINPWTLKPESQSVYEEIGKVTSIRVRRVRLTLKHKQNA